MITTYWIRLPDDTKRPSPAGCFDTGAVFLNDPKSHGYIPVVMKSSFDHAVELGEHYRKELQNTKNEYLQAAFKDESKQADWEVVCYKLSDKLQEKKKRIAELEQERATLLAETDTLQENLDKAHINRSMMRCGACGNVGMFSYGIQYISDIDFRLRTFSEFNFESKHFPTLTTNDEAALMANRIMGELRNVEIPRGEITTKVVEPPVQVTDQIVS